LDHPGPIARTVDDCAIMLGAMAGHDAKESTSSEIADDISLALRKPQSELQLSGIKIGVIKELDMNAASDDMKKTFDAHLENLRSLGAEIIEVSVPHIMHTATLYCVIARAEASSNLARYDGMRYGLRVEGKDLYDTYMKTRSVGFGDNVKFRMTTGALMLSQKFYKDCYLQAAKCRRIMDNEFLSAFEKCDLILTACANGAAITLGEKLSDAEDRLCSAMLVSANMSGLPAISVPAGKSDGLPLGLHIIGRRFDDVRVLRMAKHIEKFANLDNRPTTVMGE
jgi:aspartyl-tRNA(Asn)/glutamyl-tRNA(Gln) amidotransferase subunit A